MGRMANIEWTLLAGGVFCLGLKNEATDLSKNFMNP